jgi:uncharacterized protein (DUF427 family)
VHGGLTIAESDNALRVLETASPPTVYVPREDVSEEVLDAEGIETECEWKGEPGSEAGDQTAAEVPLWRRHISRIHSRAG